MEPKKYFAICDRKGLVLRVTETPSRRVRLLRIEGERRKEISYDDYMRFSELVPYRNSCVGMQVRIA